MRPMLFIRDGENLDEPPYLASADPVLLAAVGRVIAKHLAGDAAPALPRPPRLRAIRRALEERPKEET